MITDRLTNMIKRHEGEGPIYNINRMFPYKDSVGKWTIGWGRNISDRGISFGEGNALLENDIHDAIKDLHDVLPKTISAWNPRKEALIDMMFNLGKPRFLKFKKMIKALEEEDWVEAKRQMLDSKWAKQVGPRAVELAMMILTGEYQK